MIYKKNNLTKRFYDKANDNEAKRIDEK